MTRSAKFLRAPILTSWLFVACGTEVAPSPAPEVASESTAGPEAEAEAEAGVPRIAADEPIHDFGAIKATDSIEHVFKIKNAGGADLKIESVQRT